MPVRSIFDEYAIWLANAPTYGILIQACTFYWGGFTQGIHLGNHISNPTLVIFENGANVTLNPYQFKVTAPERSGTTEAQCMVEGPLQGPIYDLFQYLRGDQCNLDVVFQIRHFLAPGFMSRPLANRCEQYIVTTMSFTRYTVQVVGTLARLPRFQAGIPYTVDEYPGLYV